MEYQVNEKTVGYGDDVLQMIDVAAASEVGRHKQVQALIRGKSEFDRQLVIDECAVVLDDQDVSEPVREVARAVLRAVDVDPDGPIRRLDAGKPTLGRLKQIDRRRDMVDDAKSTAADAASTAVDAVSKGLDKVKDRLGRWKS